MQRTRLAATIVGAAAVISLIFPAAAVVAVPLPATLPDSSRLFSLDCTTADVNSNQLFSVNPATGVNEVIGSGSEILAAQDDLALDCEFQPAWDAKTSTVYYIATEPQQQAAALVALNIGTGVSQKIAEFGGASAPITSIAIGIDGLAYAFASDLSFYTLDLATAVVTPLGEVADLVDSVYAFTSDPTTGEFFLIDFQGNISGFQPTTKTLSPIVVFRENDSYKIAFSMQIDSNGIFWVEGYGEHDDTLLYTIDRNAVDKSGEFVASMSYNGLPHSPQAILILAMGEPVITNAPPAAQLKLGDSFALAITVAESVGVTYRLSGTLPSGLRFDSATGRISGTLSAVGSYTYTITATNIAGSDSETYTQAVVALPVTGG